MRAALTAMDKQKYRRNISVMLHYICVSVNDVFCFDHLLLRVQVNKNQGIIYNNSLTIHHLVLTQLYYTKTLNCYVFRSL